MTRAIDENCSLQTRIFWRIGGPADQGTPQPCQENSTLPGIDYAYSVNVPILVRRSGQLRHCVSDRKYDFSTGLIVIEENS